MSARLLRWSVLVVVGAALITVPGAQVDPEYRFYHQRLHWHACGLEDLDKAGAECADVLVPLDYLRPSDRTLKIAISRVRASGPDQRHGVLLANPGGPGASGLDTVDLLGDVLTPQVRARFDLIGMDPRGVGDSGRTPRCGWPVGEMIHSAGVDAQGFARETALAADMAAGCLADDPVKVRQLTTRNTARDMDVIRVALGEPKLSYYGVSYGTYLGAVFTQMFPDRSDRMVFDSAIDPDRYWTGLVQDWGASDEQAIDEWSNWAAGQDDKYHFGSSPTDVRAWLTELIVAVARQPIVIEDFPINDHWLPFLLHNLVTDFRRNQVLAETLREIADAAGGPPVAARAPRLQIVLQALRSEENSVLAQIACGDAAAPTDSAWYAGNIEASRATQPIFGPLANNIQPCAFWPRPVEPATTVRNSVPVLILQATGDARTPYTHGIRLHQHLSASRLVTLQDIRIHMTFRPDLSACVNNAINTYYADGTLPAADITCHADQ
ncbi:alpha/beta fold hydrolase [Nocardia sp. NPDC050412]|uniref:alpha/beta fold hydrolase n=1 Tax=Nocardia sp. NPDC050412 TaxID=3364320 RepID=UPI00378D84F6